MHNIRIIFLLLLFITAGCSNAGAANYQPHCIIPAPELYSDDDNSGTDTVPKRTFVNAQMAQPNQIKKAELLQPAKPGQANVQIKTELVTQPAQSPVAVLNTPQKKDTALIRMLYEGFKPMAKSTVEEKIKIRHIIDSVVSKKDDPETATGSAAPSYQELVRIIDSLLKANKIDSNNKVNIDSSLLKKADSTIIVIPEKKDGSGNFIQNYWWLIVLAVLLLAGLAYFILKRKKGAAAESKIFFSYAWDQDEALIMQLYNSLKADGFNVIKDKENMGYKGVISKFMNDIGTADFVIVAISDKYLNSKFCMYELYEIFRNSGMNRDTFGKKIFPIRIDESLNLGDPDVVNGYAKYWKEQEQVWTKRVREESDSITEEQARQFQFIKRLVIDISNILSCLADINSLNLSTLKSNNFADVKSALRKAMG